MNDDPAQYDPRFDPAFQRGFDGATQAVPRERLHSTAAVVPVVDAQRRLSEASSAPRPGVQSESITPERERESEPERDREPEPRRANPFIIALLAVALLLVGGGLYLVSQLAQLFANPSETTQYDYITLQALTIGAPIIIGLGIATGIGVLFIYAARSR